MHGSLALDRGLLFVGSHAKTARIAAYDFDGRRVLAGFRFRDARAKRSTASGLAIDAGRHLWVADAAAHRVRRFTVFGREVGGIGAALDQPLPTAHPDVAGRVHAPLAVALQCCMGALPGGWLAIACAGERRHAVQVFAADGTWLASPKPLGDPRGCFRGVQGLALGERSLHVAEGAAHRIQVFRDLEFHFSIELSGAREPRALAVLEDERLVVACAGPLSELLLLAPGGCVQRVLARGRGPRDELFEPSGVAVERGSSDRDTRVAVIDRDGGRVQVFTLEGQCQGAFEELVG